MAITVLKMNSLIYNAVMRPEDADRLAISLTWPRGYKTFFMLNSAEHEIFAAHKC